MFQGRKTIKSPLSDQVLFSGEGQEGRGVTGLPHSQPGCLPGEVALGKGSEALPRSLSKLALGLCLCQQRAPRGCCVSHGVIPACWRKLAPNKISSCCCLKLQQGKPADYQKKNQHIKTHHTHKKTTTTTNKNNTSLAKLPKGLCLWPNSTQPLFILIFPKQSLKKHANIPVLGKTASLPELIFTGIGGNIHPTETPGKATCSDWG